MILTGVIVLAVVTLLPVKDVASSASIMFLMLFFMVNLCVIKIRRCMADELHYGFLMPLFPLFPILAIIERSPCDVIILKNCGADKTFKRVLVPLAGGPNGALALEIADILCEPDTEVTFITALNVDTGRHFDIASFVSEQIEKKGLDRARFKVQSVIANDPIEGICAAAKDYDLLVLGTTQKSILAQFATRSIPEEVACCCDKPTVLVKANTPVQSFLKRWF